MYVGKTINIQTRWAKHVNMASKKVNRYLYDAMNKYGVDNFEIKCIEECSEENQNSREIYWISHYKSNNKTHGYNMTTGGDGGNTWERNPNKQLTSKKLSESNTGKKRSEEFKRRMVIISTGRKVSDSAKEKIRNSVKELHSSGKYDYSNSHMIGKTGSNHHFFGKTHSVESRNKISESRLGKTYEEIYGESKAKEIKDAKRQAFIGNTLGKISIDIDAKFEDMVKHGTNTNVIAKYYNVSSNIVRSRFKEHFGVNITEYRKINNIVAIRKDVSA